MKTPEELNIFKEEAEAPNRKLADKDLEKVVGGAGDAMGKWLIGDLFTLKFTGYYDTYYFCRLAGMLSDINRHTTYVFETELVANYDILNYYKVTRHVSTIHVNADRMDPYSIIKKVYDFPKYGRYELAELEKWLA